MPRLLQRQQPTWRGDDDREPTGYDALLVNGVSVGEAHRTQVRAQNLARQAAERQKEAATRAAQVAILAEEAARHDRRPRGSGWPGVLRSVRTGETDT